jgi:hypothetical protein
MIGVEMPNINLLDWDIETSTKSPFQGKNQKLLVGYLETHLQKEIGGVKAPDVRKQVNLTTKQWEKLMANETFKAALENHAGIKYHKPEGSGRYIFEWVKRADTSWEDWEELE